MLEARIVAPHIMFMEIDHEIISIVVFLIPLIQEGQLSVNILVKECPQALANRLEHLALSRKERVG